LLHAPGLDRQALAAFGAACVDYSAATAGLHANQKTMGAGTADLGGLVSAFHLDFLTGSFGEAAPACRTTFTARSGNLDTISVVSPKHRPGEPMIMANFLSSSKRLASIQRAVQ
jgi:hypothetical protein